MQMHYRLIVTDIDGTLIDHHYQIPPQNIAALDRFRHAGGLVTVGTGRIADSARPYALQVQANAPAIIYNGGQIYDFASSQIIAEELLPARTLRILIHLLESEFRDLDPILYLKGEPLIREETGPLTTSRLKENLSYRAVGPLSLLATAPISKSMVIAEPDDLARIETALRLHLSAEQVAMVRSERNYLEVLPPGVSKGTALLRLVSHLGLSLDQVIAVGDNLNDIEMVRTAGLGIAVANAHPLLKEVANFISPFTNAQAAVADVVERFLLPDAQPQFRHQSP